MNTNFIKETVFNTVGFSYDKEIEFFEFDGVKVEYDGKKAKIACDYPQQQHIGNSESLKIRFNFPFKLSFHKRSPTVKIFSFLFRHSLTYKYELFY